MLILSVDLENIKSYRRQAVTLTPGLNAICGLNGSGKTTVLEAIGFALFDHLPYSQAAFVREGEKTGTVRIRIQALDGREYEVVRKVGSSSQYFVVDLESGVRPAERGPNVLAWIRTNALGMEGDANLDALFENAVGVPQGKMTSDFLGSANTRKSIFDPLLRVEEYERAWEHLRDTIRHVQNRTALVREEIARLETDVEKIPDLEAEAADLRLQIDGSVRRIAEIAAEQSAIDAQKQVLDALQRAVAEGKETLRGAEYEVSRVTHVATLQREQLDVALQARRAVEESEAGYRGFIDAERALAELALRERERNARQQLLTEAKATSQGVNAQIEALMEQRRQAIEDGEKAGALESEVARQADLETRLNEAAMRVREAAKIAEDLRRIDADIARLHRAIEGRATQIEAAQRAQTQVEALPNVEARYQSLREMLAGLPALRQQLKAVREQGERTRKQYDALEAAVQRFGALRAEMDAKEAVAASLPALQEGVQRLREERIRAQATLDYQQVARSDLEQQRCPLLDLQCPVVTADGRTLSRLEVQAQTLAGRVTELDAQLAGLLPQLDGAVAAADALRRLEVEAAKVRVDDTQYAEVTGELERCRREYGELAKVIGDIEASEAEGVALDRERQRLKAAEVLAGQLPLLTQAQEHDRESLEGKRLDRARALELQQTLASAEDEKRLIESELRSMGDPRSRRTRLLATAAQLTSIEGRIAERQQELQRTTDRLRAVTAELAAFAGLDTQIEERRAIKEQHHAAYERYLQHRDEATQVEARQRLLMETQQALEVAQARERECRRALDEAIAAYHPEYHEEVRRRDDELRREAGAANARHEHLAGNMARVEGELVALRKLEERLVAQLRELEDLGKTEIAARFVRDTIRAAGPALTETLLANISQVANDIFAEIMDDHAVELRWDRDYEVLVRRGPEDRKFAQLSGGEQMSAALSLRLALLKEMSEVNVAFFDEPTQNMDVDRRGNLADQIRQVRGFNQMIVISHDDTFEHHTDNLVRLVKDEDETRVEA